MKKEYILIGGYPDRDKLDSFHAGGQLTATTLLVEYAKEEGIELHIIDTTHNVFPPPTLKSKIIESKRRISKLISLLKSKDIEGVIIFSASGFSFYEKIVMALITKMKKSKTLFLIRSGHFVDFSNRSKMIRFLNKKLLKIPTVLGAQGTKWIDFYKDMGVDTHRIELIPNWIRIDETLKNNHDRERVTFLYAGWIVDKKGVMELFEVIEEHDDLKPYIFKFAGGGSRLEELQERKEKNGLDNIEFLGWVDSKEMGKEYEKCDVFVLPSHAEGFPNVILEALNHELPVISTNVGGIADSVIDNHNGFIFEPKDKERLYQAIKSLATSKEMREEFSKNGKEILRKRHDFHQNCRLIFNVFQRNI